MASPSAPSTNIFDKIEEQIIQVSNLLIFSVTFRKNELLAALREKRNDFESLKRSQIESVRQFYSLSQQRTAVDNDITQNIVLKAHQASLSSYQKQMDELNRRMTQSVNIIFYCSLTSLLEKVSKFGEIVQDTRFTSPHTQLVDYSCKLRPVRELPFSCLGKIHIDSINNRTYVVNNYFNRITVVDTKDWVPFLDIPISKPTSVAANDEFCYITTEDNTVYLTNHSGNIILIVSEAKRLQFDKPSHITVSSDNEIFLADTNNGRICVFDRSLNYRRVFGFGLLNKPLHVQFARDGSVIVLDSNEPYCLHFFTKSGECVKAHAYKGGRREMATEGAFFFLYRFYRQHPRCGYRH